MTAQKPTPAERSGFSTAALSRNDWIWSFVLAGALVMAVTQQSFWIDEASTGSVAVHPSLAAAWSELKHINGSDLQMPLYMLYEWGAEKVFGPSEWALRAAGLAWLLPGVFLLILTTPDRQERLALFAVVGTSAFTWYYASEARPYAMQIGVACAVVAALRRLLSPQGTAAGEGVWWIVLLVSIVCLCGSSLLGLIWAAPAVGAVLVLAPRDRLLSWLKRFGPLVAITIVALAILAVYYKWTLSHGARASAAVKPSVQSMAFVFYEQLGFTGLGPGRSQLRDAGAHGLVAYAATLAPYAVLVAIVVWTGVASLRSRTWFFKTLLLCGGTAAFLLAAGAAAHFRALGRHFAPLMPVWFVLFAAGLVHLWNRGGRLGRGIGVLFVLMSACSALCIRLSPQHARDDYRSAAAEARQALQAGKVVWWNAADVGALYYRVPVAAAGAAVGAIVVANASLPDLEGLGKPDLIVCSKPDIFDNKGAVARYIAERRYQRTAAFTSFELWQPGPSR